MTPLQELDNTQTQLHTYFNALELNFTSTANPLPSFEDYNQLLDNSTTITAAQDGASRGASFAIGALVDHAHLVAAIQREFNMRAKSRALYFVDGQDDINKVLDYISFMHGSYTNYIRGKAPEQGRE